MKHLFEKEEELDICEVCGLAEGSLTTDCSGEKSNIYSEDVYNGKMDYRKNIGWVKALNPTNQSWLYGKMLELYKQKETTRKIKEEIYKIFPSIDDLTFFKIEKKVKALQKNQYM